MAKNNNKVEETKVEETKVEETKTDNVSRETSAPNTNNVGQEIQPIGATNVITCTMTEEEHKARVDRIHEKQEQGLKISWDIMVDITSAKERKEQSLDGYEETEKGFEEWCETMFNIKATQVRQAVRVLTTYGKVDDKGEWSLEDKYKRYTKEKLDIIQRHPRFTTKATFDTLVDALGITPATSEGVLKQLIRDAKGLPEPTPKDNTKKSQKSEEIKTEPTPETVKATPTYQNIESKRDILLKFTTEYFTKVHDYCEKVRALKENEPLSTDAITEMVAIFLSYEKDFKEVENAYNAVGKEETTEE
jgi:hypothetical protein